MKKPVLIEDLEARSMYETATPEFKKLLETTFGKEFFSISIIDRMNSYEDPYKGACIELGEEPMNEQNLKSIGFTDDEIDYRKLKTITKAYNEGWVADYNDSTQKKWIPWFVFSPSGVRFVSSYCLGSNANAGRAARLCFKDEATSDAAGEKCTTLYAKFIN